MINTEKNNNKKKAFNYKIIKDLEKKNKNTEIKQTTDNKINNNVNKNYNNKNKKIQNNYSKNDFTSKSNYKCINKDIYFEKSKQKDELNIINIDDINITRKHFFSYICFKLSCGKNKSFFKIYENFRIKMISEEHLIRNHLNIYILLKVTERKRNNQRNSYSLKNLINLI